MSQLLNFCCIQQLTSFFRRCYYNQIQDSSSNNNVSRIVIIANTIKDLNSSMNTSEDISEMSSSIQTKSVSTSWNTSDLPNITFEQQRIYAEERKLNQIYLE